MIEGIAGSGKSVVGEKLAYILSEKNIRVRFYHEFDRMHPIRESDANNSSTLIDKTISNWRTFVDQQKKSCSVAIFDGVLSQCFIAELVLLCTDEEIITKCMHRLERIMKVLAPRIVYLYQDDIRAAITKAYNRRSERWRKKIDTFISSTEFGKKEKLEGLSGYIAFNISYDALLKKVMSDMNIDMISIETSGEKWPAYYKEITEFLSMPRFEKDGAKKLNTHLKKLRIEETSVN